MCVCYNYGYVSRCFLFLMQNNPRECAIKEEVDKDYDFFEFEDKSVANNYSLDQLKAETKLMEEEDEEFKELLEKAIEANRV